LRLSLRSAERRTGSEGFIGDALAVMAIGLSVDDRKAKQPIQYREWLRRLIGSVFSMADGGE
jgi:hypothetical protein